MKKFLTACAIVVLMSTSAFGQVFNNPTDLAIPDGASGAAVNSAIVVAGGPASITDVNLCVAITHTFDGDLDFVLEGPNGVVRHLSSDNGSSGDNYGNATQGTYFDLQGTNTIISGLSSAAPFVLPGRYFPETTALTMIAPSPNATAGDLSSYNGIDSNGTWRLWLRDDAGLDAGILRHWSLIFNDTASPGTVTDPACNAFVPPPPPPPATNLGSINPTNGFLQNKALIGPGQIQWYSFTTTGVISTPNWLIGETIGSILTPNSFGPNDTEIGIYNASGVLVVSNDDIGGGLFTSRVMVGGTPPAQVPPGGTTGPASLAAGTYYVAVGGFNTTFSPGFAVTSTATTSGSMLVTIRTPEPATMALLIISGLALARRRR